MKWLILLLTLCLSCTKRDEKSLRVGATPVPHMEMLHLIQEDLKSQGIDLELITIDDYHTPNRALEEGEIDANFFQHAPFLEEEIAQFGYHLESAAFIHIEPMGAYSLKTKNLGRVATIAIPNDPSNEARALLLLEKAHLLTPSKRPMRTILDVHCPLEIIEMDAAMLPRVLEDVDLAVIPANFALQAGLKPQEALILEEINSPYANLLAVRQGETKNPRILALIQALTSKKVRSFLEEHYPSIHLVDKAAEKEEGQ